MQDFMIKLGKQNLILLLTELSDVWGNTLFFVLLSYSENGWYQYHLCSYSTENGPGVFSLA